MYKKGKKKPKVEKKKYFDKIFKLLENEDIFEIESNVILYILNKIKYNNIDLIIKDNNINPQKNEEIQRVLKKMEFPLDIEIIIEFFEYLLSHEIKNENGIVFTPKYISDYIVENTMSDIKSIENIKIIDPGCGCGIFLVSAIDFLRKKFNIPVKKIIEDNIYGIDIINENVERCSLILKIYCLMMGENIKNIKINIISRDSLRCDWNEEFNISKIDYIIGNPPYVNTHDLDEKTKELLKNRFLTTKDGVANIFYAFIEQSINQISDTGKIGFIIPNNFLTIKSAKKLREMLKKEKNISKIIDFSSNMIFKPVRTYNCIIELSKEKKDCFMYDVIPKTQDIMAALYNIKYKSKKIEELNTEGWRLVDKNTEENIKKIENQTILLKPFIRTGIATLKDNVYIVHKESNKFIKENNRKKYEIEKGVLKAIYKIPELKKIENNSETNKYIIFPYSIKGDKVVLIDEEILKSKYPMTYKYLKDMKEELDKRDKGVKKLNKWYAYGRTQGLNKYGKKLLFSTFSDKPNFIHIKNKDALFCNGYAIFEDEQMELEIIAKVLNSFIMKYYIENTSYSIEGGYYCYQKKYIEKFSIPNFSKKEIEILKTESSREIDKMLVEKYKLEV